MAASGVLVPSLHTTPQLKLNVDGWKDGISIKKGSVCLQGLSMKRGLFTTGERSAPLFLNSSSTHGHRRQSKSKSFRSLVCKAVASPRMEEASQGMSTRSLYVLLDSRQVWNSPFYGVSILRYL
jgi:hypothetical protein